jgi:hypothetical protein
MVKRARRKKSAEVSKTALYLIAALKFISVAQKKIGTAQQQFCAMAGNWIVASNEILTVGSKIPEDLNACPHTYQLLDALQKCGEELNITQLSENVLSIKSGEFRALIPCITGRELKFSCPDPMTFRIDNNIQKAFDCIACLATEGAEYAYLAAVLLKNATAVSTNGSAILEYWHGLQLPGEYLVPKASAIAVAKAEKNLAGFGFSPNSVTFYFEDESFIKTQLFPDKFVDYQNVFNPNINVWPIPEQFYKAVRTIETFTNNSIVYFRRGALATADVQTTECTTYKIDGLPENMAFNTKNLLLIEHAVEKVAFDETTHSMYFYGSNVRGALKAIGNYAEKPSEDIAF